MTRPVRIANFSGFYGDRISAPKEMLDGGPIDFLTGDYLAELTLMILWKGRRKDPTAGYAKTFLVQMEQVLGEAMDRGVKIVTDAGGLNPAGLADRMRELAERLGIDAKIAHIEGDDLKDRLEDLQRDGLPLPHLDTGRPLSELDVEPMTANAYLGSWGVVEALDRGADVVICPRITDAVLAVAPAAWWHKLAARRLGQAGRGRRRRARDRVRPAGDRRQLPVLRRARRHALAGLPDRRDRRGRRDRHHQARVARRRGDGRHRDRATAVRDRGAALSEPGRRGALRHDLPRAGRQGPRADRRRARRAVAARDEGLHQLLGRLPELDDVRDGGAGHRPQGQDDRRRVAGQARRRRPLRDLRREADRERRRGPGDERAGVQLPACDGQGPRPQQGRPRVLQRLHRARARRLPRATSRPRRRRPRPSTRCTGRRSCRRR